MRIFIEQRSNWINGYIDRGFVRQFLIGSKKLRYGVALFQGRYTGTNEYWFRVKIYKLI